MIARGKGFGRTFTVTHANTAGCKVQYEAQGSKQGEVYVIKLPTTLGDLACIPACQSNK